MPRTDQKKIDLCKSAVERVNLDLSDINVLTELGTNQFAFLPILASMANAGHVTAFVRDTKYGSADIVEEKFNKFVEKTNFSHKINIKKNNLNELDVSRFDIITNSYMLRPFNQDLIFRLKPLKTVITLMYEAWEFRETDIDLIACEKNQTKVCGVLEGSDLLPIFDFCGPMIAKTVFQAGFEIMKNRIIILSGDAFGEVAKKTFQALGAEHITLTNNIFLHKEELAKADFLLLADYNTVGPIFGESGSAPLDYLNKYNPHLNIIHLYGEIYDEDIQKLKGRIFPQTSGMANVMSRNLAFCGEIPVFWLQAASLKAAQETLQGGVAHFSQQIKRNEF